MAVAVVGAAAAVLPTTASATWLVDTEAAVNKLLFGQSSARPRGCISQNKSFEVAYELS